VAVELPAALVPCVRETVLLQYRAALEALHLAFGALDEAATSLEEVRRGRGRLGRLDALLAQLAPENVASQFDQSRARSLAPGQDSRTGYWDYFTEFHRMLTQHPVEGLPHPFAEAFAQAYARTREELRSGRRDREPGV